MFFLQIVLHKRNSQVQDKSSLICIYLLKAMYILIPISMETEEI